MDDFENNELSDEELGQMLQDLIDKGLIVAVIRPDGEVGYKPTQSSLEANAEREKNKAASKRLAARWN